MDNIFFENIFLGTGVAEGMISRGEQSGIIHNFTMHVDPGYKLIEVSAVVYSGIRWKTNIFFQILGLDQKKLEN